MANFFKNRYLPYFYSYFKLDKPPTYTSGPNVQCEVEQYAGEGTALSETGIDAEESGELSSDPHATSAVEIAGSD